MRRMIVLMAVSTIALTACASDPPADSPAPTTQTSASAPPTISSAVDSRRGTLVSSEQVVNPSAPLVKAAATQYRVVYRSASGLDGSERDVSGSVFVPPGDAPPEGWPVIAYGHGLTGITNDCGPSGYPDLLGYDQVVASLIDLGYVVTLADYEGLGHDGIHPLLEPTTAAFNMIDSVRAAIELAPTTSTRWFAVGVSQGGHASWAANELAGEYGDGLNFLGSASLSPAADLSGLPALAESGWLTKDQQVLLPTLVFGLKQTHPNLDPDDYLHGALSKDKKMWLACTGPLAEQRSAAVGALTASDSMPDSPEATKALTEALASLSVAQRKATGPMLVITGSDDETVREQWVAAAVRRACSLNDDVEFVVRPGEGHTDLNGGPKVAEWLSDRLAGTPPTSSCGDL